MARARRSHPDQLTLDALLFPAEAPPSPPPAAPVVRERPPVLLFDEPTEEEGGRCDEECAALVEEHLLAWHEAGRPELSLGDLRLDTLLRRLRGAVDREGVVDPARLRRTLDGVDWDERWNELLSGEL